MKPTIHKLAAATIAVALLGGCSTVEAEDSKYPTLHSERVKMASIVDGIKNMLPAEAILSVEVDEGLLACGTGDILQGTGDGTQILAYRRVLVTSDFDALTWMESIATSFEQKPGWRVVREGPAGDDPDSYADTFWSPENHDTTIVVTPGKIREDGVFSARDDAVGVPAQKIALASASSCAEKPDNWDAWGDFLLETPLPTPPPAPDSTPSP